MSPRRLGCVRAKIEQKLDFDPEALLLGQKTTVRKKLTKPSEFRIFINSSLQKIGNVALRKEVAQSILIHELLHIGSRGFSYTFKRIFKEKKEKIHVNQFEDEVFKRFNMLREKKGIMQIEKKSTLEAALSRILASIRWK